MTKRRAIRNVARGILVNEKRVLLIEVDDGHGRWWILPGGGQDFGETLEECLIRECREELDIEVKVGPCVMVREFLSSRRQKVVGDLKEHHSVEFYFELTTDDEPELVPREDLHRRLEWVPVERVREMKFFPRALADQLPELLVRPRDEAMYTGDVD